MSPRRIETFLAQNLERFWTISSLYAKLIKNIWTRKPDNKIHTQFFVPRFFNTPISYTTNTHFYNPLVKIVSTTFFSSSGMQKFHHLKGCHAIDINSLFHSFLSALHFLNLICLTLKAVLIRLKIRITFVIKKLFQLETKFKNILDKKAFLNK